jgi:four helix bundle protein
MQDLKSRTRAFALSIIQLTDRLPNTRKAERMGDQVFRSGTSVHAHYREAIRAKSDRDFVSKIEGALQELEESVGWLELLTAGGVIPLEHVQPILQEANELTAIFVTIAKKVKARSGRRTEKQSDEA